MDDREQQTERTRQQRPRGKHRPQKPTPRPHERLRPQIETHTQHTYTLPQTRHPPTHHHLFVFSCCFSSSVTRFIRFFARGPQSRTVEFGSAMAISNKRTVFKGSRRRARTVKCTGAHGETLYLVACPSHFPLTHLKIYCRFAPSLDRPSSCKMSFSWRYAWVPHRTTGWKRTRSLVQDEMPPRCYAHAGP